MSYLPKELISQTVPLVLGRRKQFPSIFRIIPERLNLSGRNIFTLKISALTVLIVYLMLASLSQSRLLTENRKYLESLKQNRSSLEKQAVFWRSVTARHQNYPDAYLMLAQIEYRLGNQKQSDDLLNKALVLNPELRHSAVLGEFAERISE